MKFISYMQLVIALIINVCVWVLVIKNIIAGNVSLLGAVAATLIIVIAFLFIPFAMDDIKEIKSKENNMRR